MRFCLSATHISPEWGRFFLELSKALQDGRSQPLQGKRLSMNCIKWSIVVWIGVVSHAIAKKHILQINRAY